jgi:transposase
MRKSTKCSPEVRERAVRMVQEHRGEYPSLWAAIELIAPKIGCVPQTLHEWVRKQKIDTGMREGTTSEELVDRREVLQSPGRCQRPVKEPCAARAQRESR